MRIGVVGLVYLVVGLVVAANHAFLGHLGNASQLLSALAAIVLWPLLLLGVHFTVHVSTVVIHI